jgi:cell division protein FtsB
MRVCHNIFLLFILAALLFLDAKLIHSLAHARREQGRLSHRLNFLAEKNKNVADEFVLKQDHMRKMLTDENFVEQIIRQKEGYVKQKEMVFRFEN